MPEGSTAPVGNGTATPYNSPVLAALAPAVIVSCLAATPSLDAEIGRRALPWLPPDLARQVARRPKDFARGIAAARSWPAALHTPGGASGLEAAIVAQCQRIAAALRQRAPMAEVVAGLGTLAHLAADLASPFAEARPHDPHAAAFASYLDAAAPRVPVVFYGQDHAMVTGPPTGITPLLTRRRQESRRLAPIVRDDLDRLGGAAAWARLDDRSSTFGAASIALNHAMSDFVNLASWAWHHGGGLVPRVEAPPGSILVWIGEPKPRESNRPRLRF